MTQGIIAGMNQLLQSLGLILHSFQFVSFLCMLKVSIWTSSSHSVSYSEAFYYLIHKLSSVKHRNVIEFVNPFECLFLFVWQYIWPRSPGNWGCVALEMKYYGIVEICDLSKSTQESLMQVKHKTLKKLSLGGAWGKLDLLVSEML